MRNEPEMLALILDYARADENIRVVVMNGSRVNPNAPRDPFQDYDVVYLARDPAPLIRNPALVRYFGEMLILQTPEDMGQPPPANDGSYAYLMQFMDGVRIDLSICPLERLDACLSDSLTRVLLDKDGLVSALPLPTDRDYLPARPTAKEFADCCNEFWWLNPYVAKALWRGEPTNAKYFFDALVHEEFMRMLTWYFGVQTAFRFSAGKAGKYLHTGLDPALWAQVLLTYPDAQPAHIWDALFLMGELFGRLARDVAAACGFAYAEQDDRNVSAYIRHIRGLSPDATEI